ncbi:MAG TPA: Na+/H+ antiporter NhaC [Leptospiraceae bacterium]|nr:Na+/H+ antiporter NhaC [Spirochaetaceae bacterium]HBS05548.1 Na+/H+ antiporter NhaC [Leptospiraceae bacterium]|tara:strand:+ start:58407 stop:59888 length:1482 start_codon:yes stop_codon:yes gene_type:complete
MPLWLSLLPVIFLISGLLSVVWLTGEDATAGPSQVVLILSGFFAALLSLLYSWHRNRSQPSEPHSHPVSLSESWRKLENSILSTITEVLPAILILLLIGALIGVWILSGIVPALIVWGIALLNPSVFFFTACILAALVSLVTGSSWSTAGTVGVALIGVGQALGMDPAITAGAVVSGAYFGDKMSPFSETTNLAASMAGVDLFAHIRHMMFTTAPALLISLVVFLFLGHSDEGVNAENLQKTVDSLNGVFWIHPTLLLVPAITFFMIYKKVPAIPAILTGSILGSIIAALFQRPALGWMEQEGMVSAILAAASNGPGFRTGNEVVDQLINRGGMSSMLGTIWLILSAMFFAGVMEGAGMIQSIASAVLSRIKSVGGLVTGTILGGIFANVVTSEQYLSIVVNGRFFREAYQSRNVSALTLSRSLEDSGTLTSALVPWNTCGAFMAATLQTPVLLYAPFALLNWITPIIALIYAWTGRFLGPTPEKKQTEAPSQ